MEQQMREFVQCFLTLNPSPSDAQYHALAEAVGVDKETLEACAYQMLGEQVQEGVDVAGEDSLAEPIGAYTQDEKVLQDQYDPNTTTTDAVPINDGGPGVAADGFHEETHDDGLGVEDQGLDLDVQDELYDDGVPVPIGAAARLRSAR